MMINYFERLLFIIFAPKLHVEKNKGYNEQEGQKYFRTGNPGRGRK